MPINKKEILALPADEKLALVEELWDSIDEGLLTLNQEEKEFVQQRYQAHLNQREEAISFDEFQKKIKAKHGF